MVARDHSLTSGSFVTNLCESGLVFDRLEGRDVVQNLYGIMVLEDVLS